MCSRRGSLQSQDPLQLREWLQGKLQKKLYKIRSTYKPYCLTITEEHLRRFIQTFSER